VEGNGVFDLFVADIGETPSNILSAKEQRDTMRLMAKGDWMALETRLKRFQGKFLQQLQKCSNKI
jgi:uncharacterized Rossmann fold enzyme